MSGEIGLGLMLIVIAIAAPLLLSTLFSSPRALLSLYSACVSCTGLTVTVASLQIRPEIWGLAILVSAVGTWHRTEAARRRPFGLYALPAFALAVSAVYAPRPLPSVWIALQLAMALAAFWVVRARVNQIELVKCFTVALSVISLISLGGYVLHNFGGLPTSSAPGIYRDGRLIGFSYEVNIFACQCCAWLAVVFYWRRLLSARMKWASAPIFVAGLLADTRAAWFGLALISLMWVRSLWKSRPLLGVAASGSIAAAVLVVLSSGLGTDKSAQGEGLASTLANLTTTTSGTGLYRVQIYQSALSDLHSPAHLIHGTGMNSFSQFHLVDATNVGAAYLSSIWLELLYDVGLIGVIAFLLIISTIVWWSDRRGEAAIVVVSLLICASTTNVVWFAFFWVYLGLLRPKRVEAMSADVPLTSGLRRSNVRALGASLA